MQPVTSELILSDYYELAYRAHTGTSFTPEKRAFDIIKSHSTELEADLAWMPEHERLSYKTGYISKFKAWLSAKSNCISTMITGGSNFPVHRAEKANNSEHKRSTEFTEWRELALQSITKRAEKAKPQSVKDDEQFALLKESILSSAKTIIGIDNGTVRGYSRGLFVSSIVGKINRLAKYGHTELLERCLDLIKQINSENKKPIISAKNSIWKLTEAAEAAREQQFDNANKASKEFLLDGCKVIFNYELDRLQIVYEVKPEYSAIKQLKGAAFKWSPSNMAWQRQLTNNAIYATVNIVGEFRKEVK